MKDLNCGTLIGRVVKDAELNFLGSGSAKCDFTVAFTTTKKNGNEWVDESNFVDFTIWGKTAENLKQYLVKGCQVAVAYHLKQERWEKDGQKQSRLKPIVDDVQLLSRPQNQGSGQNNQQSAPTQNVYNENQAGDGFQEDIPF